MNIILTIILLFFLFSLLIGPIIKLVLKAFFFKKFSKMGDYQDTHQQSQDRDEVKQKKIFTKEDGEYVDYEEIKD